MKQTWRWFGPNDTVSIDDIVQAGATGIVTALHHVPNGTVWSLSDIKQRQSKIAMRRDGNSSGLTWDVVESLPVSEDIKTQKGAWRAHITAYKDSLENIARAGIKVVCYNFMPVLDWTRTDLAFVTQTGSTTMRFDLIDFAAFDIFVLKRRGAQNDFSEDTVERARARHAVMTDEDAAALLNTITKGLPGANQTLSFNAFRDLMAQYSDLEERRLRSHLRAFLEEVVPVAEQLGLRLCCHPDDPPFPLLGLPRIVSTEADYVEMTSAVESPANGITLCSGSLGVHPENDLPGMVRRLGDKIHFLHLRNVTREEERLPCSFHEAAHLEGATDIVALLRALGEEEARRERAGRNDWSIPMRPDHGQAMADDIQRASHPGYPLVGRLRGLAELRGVATALGLTLQ